jgi:hypothetical protein
MTPSTLPFSKNVMMVVIEGSINIVQHLLVAWEVEAALAEVEMEVVSGSLAFKELKFHVLVANVW